MKTVRLSNASRPLADYTRELNGEILLVNDAKGPVAAIVPLKAADRESIALSAHPEFLKVIARSRAKFEAGQTLTLEEMRKAILPQPKADAPLHSPKPKLRRA